MGAWSKQKEKIWISPNTMEKGLHIKLECIYNCYKVMHLALILCVLVEELYGKHIW